MNNFTLKIEGKIPVIGVLELQNEPIMQYGFAIADDFLPPATLQGLTDTELKSHPELWPFDVFRKHRNHPLNKNLPATVTTLKKDTFTNSNKDWDVSTAWLEYWADNCALAWCDEYSWRNLQGTNKWEDFLKNWLWLTKGTEVITNSQGWSDGYYDPVSGLNAGKKPAGIDSLHMERNVFKHLSDEVVVFYKQRGFLFETMDGSKMPPDVHDVNWKTHPHFWTKANILMADEQRDENGDLYPYLPNGHLGLDPFPQGWTYNRVTPLPVVCMPLDILGAGINWIPENRVHLTDGKLTIIDYVPDPFNPERPYIPLS